MPMTSPPPAPTPPAPADAPLQPQGDTALKALDLKAAQTAQALAAIRGGEVDALFIAGSSGGSGGSSGNDGHGGWMFTLEGADRAYRLLIEDMAEGALTLTPEGHVGYANRRFAELLGRPLQQVIGAPIAGCFAPEQQAALTALLCQGRQVKCSGEIDLMTDVGARVPTYLSVSPLVTEGLPGALGLVVTDLSGQKRSEAAIAAREHLLAVIASQRLSEASLRKSLATQNLLRACMAHLNDIVLITEAEPFDEPGPRIVFVNDAFTRRTGYTRAEALGRTPRFLQGAKTDRAELARVGAALKRREPVRTELVNYAKDGTEFWIDMLITPVADAAGTFTHWVAIERDVSERKHAEATQRSLEHQVREAQKMEAIGTLAGGIAHDFNNILGAILGNVALAQLDLASGHPALTRLAQIAISGARARSLVEQILTFSRREPPTLKTVPLGAIVQETVAMLRATLPSTAKLSVLMTAQPLRIHGDATQLQQVLLNLCTNAWHALTDSTGSIEVGLERLDVSAHGEHVQPRQSAPAFRSALTAGSYAHLSVTDNGRGMDNATRARVFEPFFTTKPAGQGTGLGLSVVHGIVASHGGTITVGSGLGTGTRFDLYFPLLKPDAGVERPVAAAPTAVQGCGQHVLYIDDDEVMLVMVEHLLRKLGYRATCLADPRAAIAVVQSRADAVDLVVTDFNMPLLSGLDVARTLRDIDSELPVVICSGFISEALRADATAVGVVALMRKEHTLDELGAVVEQALAAAVANGNVRASNDARNDVSSSVNINVSNNVSNGNSVSSQEGLSAGTPQP